MRLIRSLTIALALNSAPTMSTAHEPVSLAPMLEKVLPAVVMISTAGSGEETIGSGVIIDAAAGHILTNSHLLEGVDEAEVSLRDGEKVRASLVGADPETDLAVLSVPAKGLSSVPMGRSSGLRVGDYVVAIGNPYGIGQTATLGIVSALGRTGLGIEDYENFIQTDAAVNPGNSGGALVNLDGEIIGVPTAIVGPPGNETGIGLAVPIDVVRYVVERLVRHGEMRRGDLGIVAQDLTPELAHALKAPTAVGAVVAQMAPGSSAETAGLELGDIITQLGPTRIATSSDIHNFVSLADEGSRVPVAFVRGGKPMRSELVLGKIPVRNGRTYPGAGLLRDVTFTDPDLAAHNCGTSTAALISDVAAGGSADRAGLAPGDIVVSVGLKSVTSAKRIGELLAARESGPVILGICRSDGAQLIVVGDGTSASEIPNGPGQ